MADERSVKEQLEAIIDADPHYQEALLTAEQDNKIITPLTNVFLEIISDRLNEDSEEFNVKHGFLALAKAIKELVASMCKDKEEFAHELQEGQKLASETLWNSLFPPDKCIKCSECDHLLKCHSDDINYDNFSFPRLMMVSGSFIDYAHWKYILAEIYERDHSLEEPPMS